MLLSASKPDWCSQTDLIRPYASGGADAPGIHKYCCSFPWHIIGRAWDEYCDSQSPAKCGALPWILHSRDGCRPLLAVYQAALAYHCSLLAMVYFSNSGTFLRLPPLSSSSPVSHPSSCTSSTRIYSVMPFWPEQLFALFTIHSKTTLVKFQWKLPSSLDCVSHTLNDLPSHSAH